VSRVRRILRSRDKRAAQSLGSVALRAAVGPVAVISRRWLPGFAFALLLAFRAAVAVQAQPAPALAVTCSFDANGNAVFTVASSADPGTTIGGTYTVDPGGPADAPFSLTGVSSVGIAAPFWHEPDGDGRQP